MTPWVKFLSKYTSLRRWPRLRIEFFREIPVFLAHRFPGDEEGLTTSPWTIALTLRVRWLMFQRLLLDDGVRVLFRQIAYAEFWQRQPFVWPFRYFLDPDAWDRRADRRADDLLQIWQWNEERRNR